MLGRARCRIDHRGRDDLLASHARRDGVHRMESRDRKDGREGYGEVVVELRLVEVEVPRELEGLGHRDGVEAAPKGDLPGCHLESPDYMQKRRDGWRRCSQDWQ